ncbi:hypothetical protein Tco_1108288 [Tanacetum coccineum]
MAAISNVPQLVDKEGGIYSAVAPRLEPGKFNKWKKRMLCYLTGMEPYYIQCIKDGHFQPKTTEGVNKPESQWTPDARRVVNQDQYLESIIISCLPDDIMESVISFETTKDTWTDLVHIFEGPSDSKENRIMDLKLEFVYEDNLISRRYLDTKKVLITTPSDSLISTAFFSTNIMKDFQENLDDEADERTSEEYLRDLDIEFHEKALLAYSKRNVILQKDCFSKMSEPSCKSPTSYLSSMSKGFQPMFTLKLIQSSQHDQSSQSEPKAQNDYKAEYKKMKAKLALLEASPLTSQFSKPFQSKNKGLVAETFD